MKTPLTMIFYLIQTMPWILIKPMAGRPALTTLGLSEMVLRLFDHLFFVLQITIEAIHIREQLLVHFDYASDGDVGNLITCRSPAITNPVEHIFETSIALEENLQSIMPKSTNSGYHADVLLHPEENNL